MNRILEKIKKSRTFCILPWINLHVGTTGDLSLCCRSNIEEYSLGNIRDFSFSDAYQFRKLNILRRRILREQPLPQCQVCYQVEKNKGLSLRQSFLMRGKVSFFARNLGFRSSSEFLKNVYEQNGAWDLPPIYLDLKPGNICNLQCRMCGPRSSNQIVKIGKRTANLDWLNNRQNYNKIKKLLPRVVQLKIGGGEPTIMDSVFRLLDECVTKGYARRIILTIVSNGLSINRILPYANKFKEFKLKFSIDATGHIYEHIRYPARWKTVERNFIKALKRKKVAVSVNTVVMLTNVYYLYHDFLPWVDQQSKIKKFTVNPIFIRNPKYYSPYLLPLDTRRFISQKFREQLKKLKNINRITIKNFKALSNILLEPGFSEEDRALGFMGFIRECRK